MHAHALHTLSFALAHARALTPLCPGNTSFVPFFAIFMNAVLAFLYGLYIYNHTIMFVNFIGVTLSTYYIWQFYNYTRDKVTGL